MPGLVKFGNITLKKGVFIKDNLFIEWYTTVKMNTVKRTTITINLIDEGGNPTMTWTLQNAWPTKVTGTDLKSDGNEVAVETIEIAHEGLNIVNK
ncbi:phage tail protein [Flavobacterium cellulosilyticum]|uniref:phage tail protein n=1 Tax=Flavobacterium cellulosilyticum TaxID=2541731 RepID=UPI001FEBF6A8|nr:phage tail protein [Flavobacterium cellulosilyticum]